MAEQRVGNEIISVDYSGGSRGKNTASDLQGAFSAFQSGNLSGAGRAGGYIQDIMRTQGATSVQDAAARYLAAAGVSVSRRAYQEPTPATPAPATPPPKSPIEQLIEDLSTPLPRDENVEVDTTNDDGGNALYSTDQLGSVLGDLFRNTFGSDNDTLTPTTEYVPIDTFGTSQTASRSGGGSMILILLLLAGAGAAYYYFVYRRGAGA